MNLKIKVTRVIDLNHDENLIVAKEEAIRKKVAKIIESHIQEEVHTLLFGTTIKPKLPESKGEIIDVKGKIIHE